MSGQPIGVFDSGLGGLTAVKQIRAIMPHENIIYFGDTGRVPYGSRSVETIRRYATQDAHFLLSNNVKMVIAACGTVSSNAKGLEEKLTVPFTGVIAPTALAAVKATKNGRIGVIGTKATVASCAYKNELERIRSDVQVFQQDCPLFVPLVEEGIISPDDPIIKLTVERYLKVLKEQKVDTIILGCTHYPILKAAIGEYVGMDVKLIDSGKETAIRAKQILEEKNLLNESQEDGECKFFVSDRTEGFANIASIFLHSDIVDDVSRIDIQNY